MPRPFPGDGARRLLDERWRHACGIDPSRQVAVGVDRPNSKPDRAAEGRGLRERRGRLVRHERPRTACDAALDVVTADAGRGGARPRRVEAGSACPAVCGTTIAGTDGVDTSGTLASRARLMPADGDSLPGPSATFHHTVCAPTAPVPPLADRSQAMSLPIGTFTQWVPSFDSQAPATHVVASVASTRTGTTTEEVEATPLLTVADPSGGVVSRMIESLAGADQRPWLSCHSTHTLRGPSLFEPPMDASCRSTAKSSTQEDACRQVTPSSE